MSYFLNSFYLNFNSLAHFVLFFFLCFFFCSLSSPPVAAVVSIFLLRVSSIWTRYDCSYTHSRTQRKIFSLSLSLSLFPSVSIAYFVARQSSPQCCHRRCS